MSRYTTENTTLSTWFERDRKLVVLYRNAEDPDASTEEERVVVQWVDEHYDEAVEDGFLNPRRLHETAVQFANSYMERS